MRVSKLTLIFVALIALPLQILAQKNFAKDADMAFAGENYFTAIELYKKAYAKEKSKAKKAEILFKIGECYRYTLDHKQAETWYKKAIKAKYADPIATLYIADALKLQGRYEEAIVEYNNYKNLVPGDKRGEDGVKSCEMAKEWVKEPTRYEVAPETQLNSKQFDFSPTYADKKYNTLYFTSSREGSTGKTVDGRIGENFSDIYESKRDKNGKWSTPAILAGDVNTPANEGASAVNKKGNTMYFTRCEYGKNKVFGCAIYQATKQGNAWTNVTLLDLGPDTAKIGHPAISDDESMLIFSSDMQGGMGGKDLWMITYDKKSKTWSKPKNLGSPINTEGDEMFPFIHKDGTLYFASNGHLGMGGLDIFRAEKTGEGTWANVANMRYPINSPADDYGIIFEGEKERGFFTSNREGSMGGDDIWRFNLPPLLFVLQGVITDVDTKKPIPDATIKLIGSDGSVAEVKSDATGFYKFAEKGNERYLNPNTSYSITVSAKDYLNGKGKETTVGLKESTTFVKDFALQTTKKKEIRFPEVLYDLGKYTLRPESEDSLMFLYQTLIDNPTIVIELSAHTDSRGSEKSNQILSENRAKSCVDFLISKGIDPERLVPKGYGETRLLVTDAEIAKLKTVEEKEAAHQKNRRTVFSVIRSDYVPKGGLPVEPTPTAPKKTEEEEDSEE
ncbi:MAG: OmpA family protein [Bacteroidia bacterium]